MNYMYQVYSERMCTYMYMYMYKYTLSHNQFTYTYIAQHTRHMYYVLAPLFFVSALQFVVFFSILATSRYPQNFEAQEGCHCI